MKKESKIEKPLVLSLDQAVEIVSSKEGISINDLAVGEALEITTAHSVYTVERRQDGFYIFGNNPKYFSEPSKIKSIGSKITQASSSIKPNFIGRGLFLEISTQNRSKPVETSQVKEIKKKTLISN